ncbi:MAG: MBL fold metallo-hydrolase [SAR324 cluster bacterium]|nr:MBL fold metallo-hydrolase [SAR324 cluster bacterium]
MKTFLLILSFTMTLASCSTPDTRTGSPHFSDGRFHNLGPKDQKEVSFVTFAKYRLFNSPPDWPESVENVVGKTDLSPVAGSGVKITLIRHATVLLQYNDLNVITDPMFSKRASPVSFAGPKMIREPAVSLENLPKIDLVLVSHSHYDHLDLPSLKKLQEKYQPTFLVGLGLKSFLEAEGLHNVVELDWFEAHSFKDATIHFLPAQHFSARTPWGQNQTLWGSFFIEAGNKKVYFAGDTAMGPHFEMTKEKLGAPDVSLLPIGAYEPRWFMKTHHINPVEAVQAHQILASKQSLAMHYQSIPLAYDRLEQPAEDLKNAIEGANLRAGEFDTPDFGESHFYK